MSTERNPTKRAIHLIKTKLKYTKKDNVLTDNEADLLTRQAIVRSAHHLWEAEQYLIDLSELLPPRLWDIGPYIAAVSAAGSYLDNMLGLPGGWSRARRGGHAGAEGERHGDGHGQEGSPMPPDPARGGRSVRHTRGGTPAGRLQEADGVERQNAGCAARMTYRSVPGAMPPCSHRGDGDGQLTLCQMDR